MRAARHKLLKLYAVKTAHRLGGKTLSRPMFEPKGMDFILEPGRGALSRQRGFLVKLRNMAFVEKEE
jgi:hypothetical protein